jgi:tRNA A-37 threonylcarbamoyl transferase component Bud32
VVVIAAHRELVERLRLDTVAGAKAFQGTLVKNHRGHRDIFVITAKDEHGAELQLYLKRNLKPYRKDGIRSVLLRGRCWSSSREEWENSLLLQKAGLRTAGLVAYGEECGLLWEKFSFLVTAAAEGRQTLREFLRDCPVGSLRKRVLRTLAAEIAKMHAAGLASPDLFTRHIFVDDTSKPPGFSLIDMARLDRRRALPKALRARDLAALHVTAPLAWVSWRERVRFLVHYAGHLDRELFRLTKARSAHLLKRRKFKDFENTPAQPLT